MNKYKWLIFLFSFNFALGVEGDQRILVKLPFKDREEILSGMRKYLKITERILIEIPNKNYEKIGQLISKIEIDKDRLYRLATRENENFMELAYKFHSTEVEKVKIAVREKNQEKLIAAMGNFLGSCNQCHDQYRLIEWKGKDYPAPVSNKKFIDKYINQIKK